MTAAELQVLVVQDLARAPAVAAVPGLPELVAERAVRYVLEEPERVASAGLATADELATEQGQLRATTRLARLLAALGWRETLLGKACARDGSGDGGHGWGWLQRDDRTPAGAADCARIRAEVPFSPAWWRVSLEVCLAVLVEALSEFPGRLDAGVCRYNASRALVLKGVADGNPNAHTTGGNYARGPGRQPGVLDAMDLWWPAPAGT